MYKDIYKEINISEIAAFRIGNAQNEAAATGCTVILCENGATAGVDVRGGSPATRETDLLRPVNTVEQIHAVMLSGGSAFGLEAGNGAMQYLAEREIGFDTGFGHVPIVCGASLFDLAIGDGKVWPDKAMGYAACVAAGRGDVLKEGNYGAGTGATVGKLLGAAGAMKSGLGVYAAQVGDVKVGAVVAVNALGDIIDYDDRHIIAGCLTPDHSSFADSVQLLYQSMADTSSLWGGNTTIGCILTNAKLTKTQCNKLAGITHNGYAQAIRPVHTTADGDSIFFLASGEVDAGVDAVGALATECMARAINRAGRMADTAFGLPSAGVFL